MIEGEDLVEKMSKFDIDLKDKNKKFTDNFLINNTISFYQLFNLICKMSFKLIKSLETKSNKFFDNVILRINSLKESNNLNDKIEECIDELKNDELNNKDDD